MPRLNIRNLGTVGYIHGITHWAYKAGDDTAGDLLSAGYWDDGVNTIKPGDWIFVSGPDWALQLYVMPTQRHIVVSVVAGAGNLGEMPPP